MENDKHEDIGWPTPEEEAALDLAALAARPALLAQTAEDDAELARRTAAAERYRLGNPARGNMEPWQTLKK